MIYSIGTPELTVQISSYGAELKSIWDCDGTEYLWQGDRKYWDQSSPVLFPFVGRLPEGRYEIDGIEYSMPIHGFASYTDHACIVQEPDRLVFELCDSAESLKSYPRRFSLKTEYRLTGKKLSITFSVENHDEKIMYFGLGGHPGFNVPLTEGTDFEDWCLEFEEEYTPDRIGFSQDSVLVNGEKTAFRLENGKRITLRHDLFDEDAIILENICRTVSLKSSKSPKSVTVNYPEMEYIGFWHAPHTDATYVCIEPWRSLPADEGKKTVFEEKEDLVSLPSGETYLNTWTIEIK